MASAASADPMSCALDSYKAQPGLSITQGSDALTVLWSGERNQDLRLRWVLANGTPTIQELAVRRAGGAWGVVASNVTADYRVTTGLRRMSTQQIAPLRGLGVELTNEIVDKYRWDPFWDAPLDMSPPNGRGGNPPPAQGVANQPGLPRKAEEVLRVSASYAVTSCSVKTEGQRAIIAFPGVKLGVFSGTLQYTIFKGTSLIQQDVLATTTTPWVAYKYHTGLKGLSVARDARVVWRDISNTWQEYRFGGAKNDDEVPLKAANRLVVAEAGHAGSIAVFPPPHNFFWAREIAINLGYNWYRKDSDATFSFGVRQAEHEDESENQANFSLYSARPGTLQRMTVFLYPSPDSAEVTFERAAAFTHGDRYKPLPGYQVMNHHYHMDLGRRLGDAHSLDADIPDLVALKALGINIVSQIDSVGLGVENPPVGAVYPGGKPVAAPAPVPAAAVSAGNAPAGRPRVDELQIRYNSIEGAKRHSDRSFLVLPAQEYYGSPLGGHTDLIFSHPVYWDAGRAPGQSLTTTDPKYGTVYHLAGADDLMEMARRENMLITMPHPRTKGSTGFPDSIRHLPYFSDSHYQGVGFRWGMGLDRSEQRLCEYRCLPLLDEMSNWFVDTPSPLKYLISISEVRHQQPGDDIYASSPVSYVKMDGLPSPDDVSPLIGTLMKGDYFVTSGEVLIPSYAVKGTGAARTVEADLEWTFPLNFVEVVWGDGNRTDRQVISTADLPASGTHHFSIPFDASGKKWVRFAAWDVAGNGALVQPVKLAGGSARQ